MTKVDVSAGIYAARGSWASETGKKSLGYLQINPKHPSLNTHPYDSIPNPINSKEKIFEAYAQIIRLPRTEYFSFMDPQKFLLRRGR